MFMLFLTLNVVVGSSADQESAGFFNGAADMRNNRGMSNMHQSFMNPLTHNATYIDKDDNILRVPTKYYEEPKKNKIKKSAKRTVQKIIKKNKLKGRKLYLFPAISLSTVPPKSDHDNEYSRNDISTTEPNFRKRSKKNPKYSRYPMPFQNRHRKDGHRYKRQDRDLYIIKDLDEIEFLSKEKDHTKVVAHVKKYW